MPKIYSDPPYSDDYDPSKGYVGIVALPGRVEQAREFTQLGTMMTDFIGRVGDSIYSNGEIIDGCELIIQIPIGKATISSGRLYLNGLVRLVNETELDITGSGIEIIGAKILEELITEVEDPSLRDPASSFENFGQPGAYRSKESVVFAVNDATASPVYRLVDGEVLVKETDVNVVTTETLARRTYEENGNYKIYGLEIRDRSESDADKVYVSLTDGKGYIEGYEVTKPSATTVPLDKSTAHRSILDESIIYITGELLYDLVH